MMSSETHQDTLFTPTLLLLMWAAINVMDVLLTYQHLSWGGAEGNPLLAGVQANLGVVSMLAAKMTGALIFGIVFYRLGKGRYLARSGAGMSVVVLYNAAIIPLVLSA